MTDARIPEHLAARMPKPPPSPEPQVSGGGGEALIAFAHALTAIEHVAKTQTADTGKYSYRYADLGDVIDECKRACGMFNLAVTQNPSMTDNGLFLTVATTIIHAPSGEWLTFPPIMLKMPNDAQALGSAMTYLRRYALLTIFGIAPDDDDGKAATRAAQTEQQFPGSRSGAEARARGLLSELSPADRGVVQRAFKIAFGMILTDLPVSKHGDALEFVIDSIANLATLREAEQAQAAAEAPQAEPETVSDGPATVAPEEGASGASPDAPSAPAAQADVPAEPKPQRAKLGSKAETRPQEDDPDPVLTEILDSETPGLS